MVIKQLVDFFGTVCAYVVVESNNARDENMDKLIFTVLNSMKNTQARQTNNAHEIANAVTPGFKKSYNEEARSLDIYVPGTHNSRAVAELTRSNAVDMSPGTMMVSGRDLDIYVNDLGAIAVQGPQGQDLYTRRGDLSVSADGALVTGSGSLVLGDNGPITVPQGSHISITSNGTVTMVPSGTSQEVAVGRIKLVDTKGQNLIIREDGLYQAPSGELPASAEVKVTPRALEGSNVNVVDSMVRMIALSREYEMTVNMIKHAREIDEASASTMRLN